jgi:hypothetical protein
MSKKMHCRSKPEKVAGLPSMFCICDIARNHGMFFPKGKTPQQLADFKKGIDSSRIH